MKKFAKALLAIAMAAAMVVPAALGASAAELTINPNGGYGNSINTGCGFLDGNLYAVEGLKADSVADLTVTVNGKTAYMCDGYLGMRHGRLHDVVDGDAGKVAGGMQVGIIGADVVSGTNTVVVTDKDGNTLTQTFDATITALGYTYAKVTGDAKAKTMTVEVAFNTDPGFAIGTTFEGKCHDDHGSTGEFKVTAYDADTKVYTITSTDFATKESLLELKVTSDGDYKDAFVCVAINAYNYKTSDGGVIGGNKVTITEITANRGDAANLIDGTENKLEGGVPSESDPITITFKTESAVKIETLVLYTGGDDETWNNRAPGAFKLYGIASDGAEVLIKDVADSGMQNKNFTPYATEIGATVAYDSYKLVITSRIDREVTAWYNDWFQLGELEVYSVAPTVSYEPTYEQKTGAVAYLGIDPNAPVEPDTTPVEPDTTPVEPDTKPAPTGDALTVMIALSAVAMAAIAVVISKKRSSAC